MKRTPHPARRFTGSVPSSSAVVDPAHATRTSRPLPVQLLATSAARPVLPEGNLDRSRALVGRSKQAVNEAIAALADKGVLHPITLAKRNRAWEARDLFDLINDVERELATPSDIDEPSRPSPRQTRAPTS
jgi:hypothetical protein